MGRPCMAALLLLIATAGCAGYQVGNRTLFNTDMRTVYIPMFQSDSLRPDLAEWLTEAVIKEVEMRTPYKVVSNPLADSVLTGRLLWDNKRVVSENFNDEPRALLYNAALYITWIDRNGRILTQSSITVGETFVPEAGQSIASVEAAVVRHMAAQVVNELEAENW